MKPMRSLLPCVAAAAVLAGCGGANSVKVDTTAFGEQPPGIARARTWPGKWCRAQIGMTREQMRDLMGAPTGELTTKDTAEGIEPQMTWDAFDYDLTAIFGKDDKVRRLTVNELKLTADERQEFTCRLERS